MPTVAQAKRPPSQRVKWAWGLLATTPATSAPVRRSRSRRPPTAYVPVGACLSSVVSKLRARRSWRQLRCCQWRCRCDVPGITSCQHDQGDDPRMRVLGRITTPNLASAPSSPTTGELYFNTTANKLYWWNGTSWIDATGGGGGGGSTSDAFPVPSSHGFLAWSTPPDGLSSQGVLGTGRITWARVKLVAAATVSTLWTYVGTLGSGLTAGQNFIGLYNSAGNLLASSADQSAVWTTTGLKSAAITPQSVAAGDYLIAIVAVGTTPPAIARPNASAAAMCNANLPTTVAGLRSGLGQSSLTALPASITSPTASTSIYWFAMS